MNGDYNMDITKIWDYRVVRRESEDGSDEWYSVQEVYYDDETGEPMAQTMDLMIEGDTITEMRTQLKLMLKSLDEPVLGESDIIPTSDVGLDLDSETKDKYIYESPDGGKTIYRRKFGDKIRENMENLRTGKRTTVEGVPLPQGTLYHTSGWSHQPRGWRKSKREDDKDV